MAFYFEAPSEMGATYTLLIIPTDSLIMYLGFLRRNANIGSTNLDSKGVASSMKNVQRKKSPTKAQAKGESNSFSSLLG